jgi:putative FmdB family regulatory protein
MPTYDYECTKCGHRFEKFQSMSDPLVKTCPKCKGKVKRLIGAGAGLLFKGEGFYITDYRSKDYKEKSKSDKETAPKGESSSSTPAGTGDAGGGKGASTDTNTKPARKAAKKAGGAGKGSAKD